MPVDAPPLVLLPRLPVIPLSPAYQGQQAYLPPGASEWMPLTTEAYQVLKGVEPDDANVISSNRNTLSEMFSSALQVPNLGFVAGSCSATRPKAPPPVRRFTVWSKPRHLTARSPMRGCATYWSVCRMPRR